MGNFGQDLVAQLAHRGLVIGQGIVKRQLVIVEPQFVTALASGGEFLGHFDQLFDDLSGFD
ncbi:hypothetical protein D3C87_2117720 [compost metagenome]